MGDVKKVMSQSSEIETIFNLINGNGRKIENKHMSIEL